MLSLLAEQPRHGYDVVQELFRREVRDWAGISRPQVYYSLEKLRAAGLIRPVAGGPRGETGGPERRVFALTAAARDAVARALDDDAWATQRPPPPFLTWMVLSANAHRPAARRIVAARRAFLEAQVAKERETLEAIRVDPVPTQKIAEAIVSLALRQFELELAWLADAEAALGLGRAPA